MTKYTAIEPQHYRLAPLGIDLECIEYIEHLSYSQGNAGKYCYRAGNKDQLEQDLKKILWYIDRADSKRMVDNLNMIRPDIMATVDGMVSIRSNLFYLICTGHLISAEYRIRQILKIIETDKLDMDAPLTGDLRSAIVEG